MRKLYIPTYIVICSLIALSISEFNLVDISEYANKLLFSSGASLLCLGGLLGRRQHKKNRKELSLQKK